MIRRTAILFWFGRNAKPLRRETTAWRKAVMAKNGGRCVISGAATGNEAAHIFNVQKFPFFAYSVWNGVPLRADLHERFDKWTGASKGKPSTILHWWAWRYVVRFFN